MRRLIILVLILVVLLAVTGALQKYVPQLQRTGDLTPLGNENVKVVTEESITIDIVKKVGPSVVTIAQEIPASAQTPFDFGPFSFFDIPEESPQEQAPSEPEGIGSGFIISAEGVILTNKHVVSDTDGKYFVVTNDQKRYTVDKIYRDPLNDIALLQITPSENAGSKLPPITLGDSARLQAGQYVVAIGTALGEFQNSVTTGVISGLGRGITAGSPFEGSVERLDNVIQTDAAINPGNSGGPLLNSSGQVIGVNTAVSANGQNIGFAIPINVVKESLDTFNKTGRFERPYLGVAYRLISREVALMNELPEGAYVQQVVAGSAADNAGIVRGDIIVNFDGQRVTNDTPLSTLIGKKKVGDKVAVTVFRDGKNIDVQVTLASATEQ
jgi:serine protease Do